MTSTDPPPLEPEAAAALPSPTGDGQAEVEAHGATMGRAPEALATDRRGFLGAATLAVGACGAACALGAVGTAALGVAWRVEPAGPEQAAGDGGGDGAWLGLGPLARFQDGVATKVAVVGARRDAWTLHPPRALGSVIVRRRGEGADVLSAVCPHNGCEVRPRADDLFCPCHDSAFGLDGAVRTGPSPRALDPLEARVRDGRLEVRWVRFALGTAERRPL